MSLRVGVKNELLASIKAADDAAKREVDPTKQTWLEQQASWLRELRARRIAMGREPDDELNAPADMCYCSASVSRQMRCGPVSHGCPLHPRTELSGAEFLRQAKAALGGGLELREDMGFCVGCGSRDCVCDPADEGFKF